MSGGATQGNSGAKRAAAQVRLIDPQSIHQAKHVVAGQIPGLHYQRATGSATEAAVVGHYPVLLRQSFNNPLVTAGHALKPARRQNDRRSASGFLVINFRAVNFCSSHFRPPIKYSFALAAGIAGTEFSGIIGATFVPGNARTAIPFKAPVLAVRSCVKLPQTMIEEPGPGVAANLRNQDPLERRVLKAPRYPTAGRN